MQTRPLLFPTRQPFSLPGAGLTLRTRVDGTAWFAPRHPFPSRAGPLPLGLEEGPSSTGHSGRTSSVPTSPSPDLGVGGWSEGLVRMDKRIYSKKKILSKFKYLFSTSIMSLKGVRRAVGRRDTHRMSSCRGNSVTYSHVIVVCYFGQEVGPEDTNRDSRKKRQGPRVGLVVYCNPQHREIRGEPIP